MTNKDNRPVTPVLIAIDASGSMDGVREDVIGGFNNYLRELQADTENAYRVTLYTFNSEVSQVFADEDPKHVRPLGPAMYKPRGSTALFDAIGEMITTHEANPLHRKPLVVIHTDGKNNASYEWTLQTCRALVSRLTADGWGFMFLGAGSDNWEQGGNMGMASANTVATREGTQGVYSGLVVGTASYARGMSVGDATQLVAETSRDFERKATDNDGK